MNSSRSSVRRKEKPGRPKRTVRRMENSTIWCPHSDPGRCSTKTSQRWNTTASVPSSRAQRAAERDPSPNSTSECCLLLVELRHYTRVQQLYLSLDLERISRPCVVLTAKILLKDLYSLFWTCKWVLTVFVLKMAGVCMVLVHQFTETMSRKGYKRVLKYTFFSVLLAWKP